MNGLKHKNLIIKFLQTKIYYILISKAMQCGASCEPGYGNALLYEFNHIANAVIIHGY